MPKNSTALPFFYLLITVSFIITTLLIFFLLLPNNIAPNSPYENQSMIAKNIAAKCGFNDEKFNWRDCYGQEFENLTKNTNFSFSLDTLHKIQGLDSKTYDCHFIAHHIGRAEVSKNPQNWQVFLSNTPNECVGGFIHGAIEALQGTIPDYQLDEKAIPQLCSLALENEGDRYCAHLMGHLLLVETLANIQNAVSICQKLPEKLIFPCSTGVFMENITRNNLGEHNLAGSLPYNLDSASKMEIVCRKFNGEPARACWQEITHYYANFSNNDSQKLFELCSRASTDNGRESCFLHGVTFIAGDKNLNENVTIDDLCKPLNQSKTERSKSCITDIVYTLTSSSTKFSERIIQLCQSTSLKESQIKCFQTLGERLSRLASPKEQKSLCSKSPEDYKTLCENR